VLYYEIKDIMTIGVIGATGKLGVSLMKQPNTVACDVRFEEAERYNQWLSDHPDVDTIWHVARACRKARVRRDFETFRLEHNAMRKLLDTRAKDCRFVYASTKVVYGITSDDVASISADKTVESFIDTQKGTHNFPEWKKVDRIDVNGLGAEHLIYAMTKLACEELIRSKCSNYKLVRIWDIT
jgi:nucleoside-diphosphate-sugar epimerase